MIVLVELELAIEFEASRVNICNRSRLQFSQAQPEGPCRQKKDRPGPGMRLSLGLRTDSLDVLHCTLFSPRGMLLGHARRRAVRSRREKTLRST